MKNCIVLWRGRTKNCVSGWCIEAMFSVMLIVRIYKNDLFLQTYDYRRYQLHSDMLHDNRCFQCSVDSDRNTWWRHQMETFSKLRGLCIVSKDKTGCQMCHVPWVYLFRKHIQGTHGSNCIALYMVMSCHGQFLLLQQNEDMVRVIDRYHWSE